jgi:hypothetical protein
MSKPRPPPAPDPVAVSNAQATANRDAARTEAQLNRVNQVTPYGSVTFSNQGDNWTQTVTESDNQRALREGQERLGINLNNLGQQQIQTVGGILGQRFTPQRFNSAQATGGPLDLARALGGEADLSRFDPTRRPEVNLGRFDPTRQLPMMDASGYDPTRQDFGTDIAERAFAGATAGMDRSFDRAAEALRTRMANQGITAGSEAFGAERSAFEEGRANAYARALSDAQMVGLNARGQQSAEMAQGFGQNLAADQRNMSALGMGADLAQMREQNMLNRFAMGADMTNQQRAQRLAELLQQRGTNLGEATDDYNRNYAADLAERQVPLQEINAIMNGAPLTPLNPAAPALTSVGAPDVLGAYALHNTANQANYQSQMGQRNALIGALGGLGGAAIGGFFSRGRTG